MRAVIATSAVSRISNSDKVSDLSRDRDVLQFVHSSGSFSNNRATQQYSPQSTCNGQNIHAGDIERLQADETEFLAAGIAQSNLIKGQIARFDDVASIFKRTVVGRIAHRESIRANGSYPESGR